jgi:hypothetical protein
LIEVNPFDYLTELQRHAEQVAANPDLWLPRNYREAYPARGTAGSDHAES